MSKILKSFPGEMHTIDIPGNTVSLFNTATVTVLNIPILGSGFYNRLGNQINMWSVDFRWVLDVPNAGPAVNANHQLDVFKLSLVYDRQTNGAAPLYSDIYSSFNQVGAAATGVYSHTNPQNSDRFLILKEWFSCGPQFQYAAGPPATWTCAPFGMGGSETACGRTHLKLKGLVTKYKGNAGTVADVATGGLFLCSLGVSANINYVFRYESRLRFTQ